MSKQTKKFFLFLKSANTWSMMQNKNNKNGDIKKNREIKKPAAAIRAII